MNNYKFYTIRVALNWGYSQEILEVRRRARSYKEAGARARQICDKIVRWYEGEAIRITILSIFEEE